MPKGIMPVRTTLSRCQSLLPIAKSKRSLFKSPETTHTEPGCCHSHRGFTQPTNKQLLWDGRRCKTLEQPHPNQKINKQHAGHNQSSSLPATLCHYLRTVARIGRHLARGQTFGDSLPDRNVLAFDDAQDSEADNS